MIFNAAMVNDVACVFQFVRVTLSEVQGVRLKRIGVITSKLGGGAGGV